MINIFAYSDKGCILAQKISSFFPAEKIFCYTTLKLADKYGFSGQKSICEKAGEVFSENIDVSDDSGINAMIFIGACGIAIRSIAPYIKNKTVDPAVIDIDDCGNFVISLLSGHIGGANDLTRFIADKINAVPVLPTATDVNGKFSVDSWAVKNSLFIGSLKAAKDVSSEILVRDVPFKSDIKVNGNPPNGLILKDYGDIGIYVSYKISNPYTETLHLIPKSIHIGIGCRRGIEQSAVDALFIRIISENNIDLRAIKSISSIDLKKDEQGLIKTAEKYNIPAIFYSSEELSELKGDFSKSDFVKSITGVDNVCERAAFKSSKNGTPIVRKTCDNGVTIAVYEEETEANFE